jgi:osmotically-inducible protein OsmY
MQQKYLIMVLASITAINFSSCAVAVVGGGSTVAAVASDTRGVKEVANDQVLAHNVKTVLDKQIPNGSFTIASYNHEVLLAGQVATLKEKNKAEILLELKRFGII